MLGKHNIYYLSGFAEVAKLSVKRVSGNLGSGGYPI